MMILFIQHIQCSTFQNSSVQYWLGTFNTVCDLLEVTKSTVPMCGCMLVVLSDIYCQSTCCLFKLAEYSSNCSSFVSMVFPSFCRTYKQHNHTEKTNTSQSFQTRTVRHDIRQRNKSCHCMATEIRLANRFHVYSWNISCSDCSLWWWGKSSISNDLNFKIHPKINRKPMTALKHGRNVGPPAGPSQKPCSHMCTTCKNKSCHCMATEIRLANRFHVYSWNISCSDYSLWWWGKSSISNDLHF